MKKRTRMMAAMVLAVAILLSAAAGCASTEVNVEEPAEEREETIEPVTETEEKNEPEPEPEMEPYDQDKLAASLEKAIEDHFKGMTAKKGFSAYDVIEIKETQKTVTVYALVKYAAYYYDGEETKEEASAGGPAAITFSKDGDGDDATYKMTGYWAPSENSYERDIRIIFPAAVQAEAIEGKGEELRAETCMNKAKEYYTEHPDEAEPAPEPESELVEATRDDIKALASMLSKAAPADVQVKEYYDDLKGTVSGEQSRLTADVLSALSKISWEKGVKNEYSPTYELVIDGESGKLTLSCDLDDFWPGLSPCDVCVKTEGKEYWLRTDEAHDYYVGYLLRMLYNDVKEPIEIDATGDRELLTAEELIKWQYEVRRYDYDADGRIKGYNLTASFLNSEYNDPREISPWAFLWYSGLHTYLVDAETHPEEYIALCGSLEPGLWAWHCSASDVNAVLKKYAGITLDDMSTDWKKEISYLPEYDAFYVGTSDMSDDGFQVMNGYREGDIITLFDEWNRVLTLQLVDGGYHFVSLQRD